MRNRREMWLWGGLGLMVALLGSSIGCALHREILHSTTPLPQVYPVDLADGSRLERDRPSMFFSPIEDAGDAADSLLLRVPTPAKPLRLRPDFAPVAEVLVPWRPAWGPTLIPLIREAGRELRVTVLVSDVVTGAAARALLQAHGVPATAYRFLMMPTDSGWLRDYGPIQVETAGQQQQWLDLVYARLRPLDDSVPARLGQHYAVPITSLPVRMEGGNIVTNGRGLCLTTERLLGQNGLQMPTPAFRRVLGQYLGCTHVVILETLNGERTGHVDMFAHFLTPDLLIMAQEPSSTASANGRVLERNLAIVRGALRDVPYPVTIRRLPMPPAVQGVQPTYVNLFHVNDLLLVPSYGPQRAAVEREVVAALRLWMPGHRVQMIDVAPVIKEYGALHCFTLGLYTPLR